jgi:hypothetical protein
MERVIEGKKEWKKEMLENVKFRGDGETKGEARSLSIAGFNCSLVFSPLSTRF